MSFKEWLDNYYPYRNRNYKQEILYAKNKYDDTYLESELLDMYKDTKQHLIDIMQEDEKLELYEEPKQETLEDKLDKIVSKEQSKFWAESDERFKNKETLEEAISKIKSENEHYIDEEAFELGAKWQQERSYSEEEVIAFGEFIFKHSLLTHTRGVKNLFERFKKK